MSQLWRASTKRFVVCLNINTARFVAVRSDFALTARSALSLSCACLLLLLLAPDADAQGKRRTTAAAGRGQAVVVDERLAALRDEPHLTARLVQRLGRGRVVSVLGARRGSGNANFYRVAVTRRTRGWLVAEALVAPARAGDDERLWRLVRASEDFERIARARIFLEHFTRSPLRPAVLLLLGDEAERAAAKLTRAAARRLDARTLAAGGASLESYFLNFNELDRYNRQGVVFVFNRAARSFHYDGAGWREIVRRYPRSPEAAEALRRLDAHPSAVMRGNP